MSRDEKITALMNAFFQLKRAMHRQMSESDSSLCMTPVQIEILMRIRKGQSTAAVLAVDMHTTPSAITQHINALVAQGFVTRATSVSDKRQSTLALTEVGEGAVETKYAHMRDRLNQLVSALSEDELDQFIALSNKIADNTERMSHVA